MLSTAKSRFVQVPDIYQQNNTENCGICLHLLNEYPEGNNQLDKGIVGHKEITKSRFEKWSEEYRSVEIAMIGFLINSIIAIKEAFIPPKSGLHIFHRHCLKNWTKDNPNCPTCRKEIDIDSSSLRSSKKTAYATNYFFCLFMFLGISIPGLIFITNKKSYDSIVNTNLKISVAFHLIGVATLLSIARDNGEYNNVKSYLKKAIVSLGSMTLLSEVACAYGFSPGIVLLVQDVTAALNGLWPYMSYK